MIGLRERDLKHDYYPTPGGGRIIPYMAYIAMCGPKGYGFTASGHKWVKGIGKWATHHSPFFFKKVPPPQGVVQHVSGLCDMLYILGKGRQKSRFLCFVL